ncbi:MAG: hypothetical protein KC503_02635 [Myxococcales bacterium]|nr:hypothetical protein [Myxococcales bacterium]
MIERALRGLLDLLERARQPERSRADEIADVRRRLAAQQRAARRASDDERQRARALETLRQQMIETLAEPASCASCERSCHTPSARVGTERETVFAAERRRAPAGFDGGACCAAKTAGVFSDDELYVLALAGATAADYSAPPGPHAGCAFRDARGCSLAVQRRPTLCLRYLCNELQSELQASGRRHAARSVAHDLRLGFEALVAERREREIDDLLQ